MSALITGHMIYVTGPERYAALVISDYPDKGLNDAVRRGKACGILPSDTRLVGHSDAYVFVTRGESNRFEDVEKNRWDVVCYSPDQKMFWDLLAGNAYKYGINTSQDFVEAMARWFAMYPEEAKSFVEHATQLPKQLLPDIGVLDPIIARAEQILDASGSLQVTH